jgi:hypothetical protein
MVCDRSRDGVEERILHFRAEGSSDAPRDASLDPCPERRAVAWVTLPMLACGFVLSLLLAGPVVAAGPEELPKALPPAGSSDHRHAVLQLMRQNKEKYGDDAALLQGLLLTHSLQGKAVLSTESTILGFEEVAGKKYVAFRLESGVVLNDKVLDRDQRLERMWHVVLERTLLHYPTFRAPADGLAVEIRYNHRPYERIADLYEDEDEGVIERAKFYMLSPDLADFLARRIGPQDFLTRSRVLLDDQPVSMRLTEVLLPPKPEPQAAEK